MVALAHGACDTEVKKPRTTRFKVPLTGVHIGPTCVDGTEFGHAVVDGKRQEVAAHAHTEGSKRDLGMICAKTLSELRELLVHEMAHLVTRTGHDDPWRRSVHRLGGKVEAAYRKRPRKKP